MNYKKNINNKEIEKLKKTKHKVAILTCGRSDFSIYLPLIKKLIKEQNINLHIIAFGTHAYRKYGYTIKFIQQSGFTPKYTIKSLQAGDDERAISKSMGMTTYKLADIFAKEKYDMLFALGDRYEMFSAVASSVPFNIPVSHIHGGEKTIGAIDEKYRHSISLMSTYHFVSTKNHLMKVKSLLEDKSRIYNVGALALDNIHDLKLKSSEELLKAINVDFQIPTLLATLHPETVNTNINYKLTNDFIDAIKKSDFQTVLTLPNNDVNNNLMREALVESSNLSDKIFVFDSLGPVLYYSCMKHCHAVIGNSSSGIIEAASFGKYTINIGDRQKGRDRGSNIIDLPVNTVKITQAIKGISNLPKLNGKNIYGKGNTAKKIISHLKRIL